MQKKTFKSRLTALAILFLASCVRTADLPFPERPDLVVANALLCPDSAIQVHLSRLAAPGKTPPPETGAQVRVYENGMLLGLLEEKGGGYYRTTAKPRAGGRYRLEARTTDGKLLEATDTMPENTLQVQGFYKDENAVYPDNNGKIFYNVKISPVDGNARYWFGAFISDFRYETHNTNDKGCGQYVLQNPNALPVSTPVFDNFNSYFNDGWYYYYELLSALPQRSYPNGFSFDTRTNYRFCGNPKKVSDMDDKQGLFVYWLSSSVTFSRYMKSLILTRINEDFAEILDEDQLPNFLANPITVYSNVKGGAGIFACYNPKSVKVK